MSEFCLLPLGSPLCIWFYRLRAFAPRREWVERQLWNCTGDLGLRAPRKPLIRQISRLVLARIIEKLSAQRVHSHTTRSKGVGVLLVFCSHKAEVPSSAFIVRKHHQVGLDKS